MLPELAKIDHGMEIFYEIKSNVTFENTRLLRDSGIVWVQPGIESLSTPILKLMKKGVTGLQNVRLLKWAAQLGIGVSWNLLYGFPGEAPGEFDRMAQLLPALSHLQPPYIEACQVRVHRFSPLFVNPDAEGLINVRPAAAYQAIYPFEPEVVARMAYYFEHEFRSGQEPNTYIAPMAAAVRKWHGEVGHAAFICFERSDVFTVLDTRATATLPRATLTGLERDVFEACLNGMARPTLAEHLGRDHADITPVLDRFIERRWVVELDGQLISLAVPMDLKLPDHIPDGLHDRTMIASYCASIARFHKGNSPPPPELNSLYRRDAQA